MSCLYRDDVTRAYVVFATRDPGEESPLGREAWTEDLLCGSGWGRLRSNPLGKPKVDIQAKQASVYM